jgi:hypothetical protein
MRSLAAASVRLERHTHGREPLLRKKDSGENLNSTQTAETVSIARVVVASRNRVLQSLPLRRHGRRVTPRSFPQLWKKMWKSKGFGTLIQRESAISTLFVGVGTRK